MSKINATAQVVAAAGLADVDGLSSVWSIISSAHTELLLFVVAVVAYFALFMQRTPKSARSPLKNYKVKVLQTECSDQDYPADTDAKSNNVDPEECAKLTKALAAAFENGDFRSVLRYWNTMKKSEKMPDVSLPHVVESMQRFKKDTPFILKELRGFLIKFSAERDMTCINDLLESLAKRLDSDLMEKIAEMLPSVNLEMDERSYEAFLNMYFTTRAFQEVVALVSQMKEKHVAFTPRASMVVIKTALKTNSFEDAVQHFREMKSAWSAKSLSSTASTAPTQIVSQLVELACAEHKLSELIVELAGMPISQEALNVMLLECVRQKDRMLTTEVEKLGREQEFCFTDATYGLLIKIMASDPIRVQALFDEVIAKDIDVTPDFAASVLAYCTQVSNVEMADNLLAYMKPEQMQVLTGFVRFYADCEQFEKACDIYENDLLPLQGAGKSMDPRMERSLMNAALKCGRSHLAKNLLNASPSDVAKHITMIRNFAAQGNLQGAVGVFESLESSGVDMNSIIYNTVLDACVGCRDLPAAEAWMEQTKKAGMADVVSFNTLIKAHLQSGNFFKARFLMHEMKKEGLQPNRVTFNELINAMVSKTGEAQRRQMWDLVDEMRDADVKPNQVTVSILLKNLNWHSGETEITKTMDLINSMDEPMDEVLLSSVVEACVRIGKPELLETQLKQLQGNGVAINGSHTYGSLIKAYGHAKDIEGIWRCWREMRSRHIKPTSITLGCMVEAVVSNGDPEGAYDLIHQMQEDANCSGALNSVIYCSVLKGFTREKNMTRALAVYEEICKAGIELSIVMYNTLIDACARCCRMELVPKILEDMKTHGAMPNLITYSTMLKGHCQNGDVQTAFALLEEMKKEVGLKPDEIMYNSLLDGCAQNSLVEQGLRLLEEMQCEGVKPSNFTLSILVKLMNRARRLDQAFSLVEEITKKYNFQPNVHVYANLVQACCSNQDLRRGVGVLETMVQKRVTPDSRTYTILVRSSISRGLFDQAVGLLRGALGMQDALPFLRTPAAVCPNLDNALVNEALVNIADLGRAEDVAVPLLASIKQDATWVRIDAATQRRVMFPCPTSSGCGPRQGSTSKGHGKGKGKNGWGRQ
jgi:pentatricopeptide repeat protein